MSELETNSNLSRAARLNLAHKAVLFSDICAIVGKMRKGHVITRGEQDYLHHFIALLDSDPQMAQLLESIDSEVTPVEVKTLLGILYREVRVSEPLETMDVHMLLRQTTKHVNKLLTTTGETLF